MLRMNARRLFAVQATAGTDRVMGGVTLPSDSVVHGVSLKSTFLGATEAAAAPAVFAIGFEGWILPILDPDDGSKTYETIFDNLVPKDVANAASVLDLDTAAADATPFFEPGEIDWTNILDVGLRPRRIFHETSIVTLANGALIVWQDNQTPFVLKYWPGGQMNFRSRKSFRVTQPSVLTFAIASPSMDATTTTIQAILNEKQLPMLKYAGDALEDALRHTLGIIEAGAETPYSDAATMLTTHLDPAFFEESGLDTLASIAWNWQGELQVDHSVTGTLKLDRIDGGR